MSASCNTIPATREITVDVKYLSDKERDLLTNEQVFFGAVRIPEKILSRDELVDLCQHLVSQGVGDRRKSALFREKREVLIGSSLYRTNMNEPPLCIFCLNCDPGSTKMCGPLTWFIQFPKFFAFHTVCAVLVSESFEAQNPSHLEKKMDNLSIDGFYRVAGRMVPKSKDPVAISVTKCYHCGMFGAVVKCFSHGCGQVFHIPCAIKAGCHITCNEDSDGAPCLLLCRKEHNMIENLQKKVVDLITNARTANSNGDEQEESNSQIFDREFLCGMCRRYIYPTDIFMKKFVFTNCCGLKAACRSCFEAFIVENNYEKVCPVSNCRYSFQNQRILGLQGIFVTEPTKCAAISTMLRNASIDAVSSTSPARPLTPTQCSTSTPAPPVAPQVNALPCSTSTPAPPVAPQVNALPSCYYSRQPFFKRLSCLRCDVPKGYNIYDNNHDSRYVEWEPLICKSGCGAVCHLRCSIPMYKKYVGRLRDTDSGSLKWLCDDCKIHSSTYAQDVPAKRIRRDHSGDYPVISRFAATPTTQNVDDINESEGDNEVKNESVDSGMLLPSNRNCHFHDGAAQIFSPEAQIMDQSNDAPSFLDGSNAQEFSASPVIASSGNSISGDNDDIDQDELVSANSSASVDDGANTSDVALKLFKMKHLADEFLELNEEVKSSKNITLKEITLHKLILETMIEDI